jgi:hypothetical protein
MGNKRCFKSITNAMIRYLTAPLTELEVEVTAARPGLRYTLGMESKVAKEAERALVEATQRLPPEQRLDAFLTHTRPIMELYQLGHKAQQRSSASPR